MLLTQLDAPQSMYDREISTWGNWKWPLDVHHELCHRQSSKSCALQRTAPLSFVGRAGHEVRPSRTLWRSGRKLPPGNIPKSQYHHPKESKEENAVALPAPQVPFCWSEIQRAWWEAAIWIQAVCYPSQQIILPAQPSCYQSLYTRGPAGVQCVQWEIPHF